jgi:hypothetical protein
MLFAEATYTEIQHGIGGVMRSGRTAVVALAALAGAMLFSSPVVADAAATYVPPEAPIEKLERVKLMADKRFGFAPMTVRLSGMVETSGGNLVPVEGGQDIRLVVASPFLNVQQGVPVTTFATDTQYEAITTGPAEAQPFHRVLQLRKTGKYVFRVQILNPNGSVLSSNEVTVTAL